jgi:Tfp pilus assembly protein PilF
MTRTLAALALAALAACAHGPSRKDRRVAEIHHDLAVEAVRNGNPAEALKEYEIALRADPRFAEAHRGRGLVLDHGFGRLDEAERAYRKALELRPRFPEAWNDLGQLLARTGRHDEALAAFGNALDDMSYREPFVARCNRGQALYRMGREAEGKQELETCTKLAPAFCAGRRELGRILLAEGQLQRGTEEMAAYARYCEKSADAHLQLGLARMKGGDAAGARIAFERCEALAPASPEAEECRRSRGLLE